MADSRIFKPPGVQVIMRNQLTFISGSNSPRERRLPTALSVRQEIMMRGARPHDCPTGGLGLPWPSSRARQTPSPRSPKGVVSRSLEALLRSGPVAASRSRCQPLSVSSAALRVGDSRSLTAAPGALSRAGGVTWQSHVARARGSGHCVRLGLRRPAVLAGRRPRRGPAALSEYRRPRSGGVGRPHRERPDTEESVRYRPRTACDCLMGEVVKDRSLFLGVEKRQG